MFFFKNNRRICSKFWGRKGVTLTELLAVVSIAGITAAIIAPDVIQFTGRIRNTLSDLKQGTGTLKQGTKTAGSLFSESDGLNSQDLSKIFAQVLRENEGIKTVHIPFGRTVTPEPAIPSISIPQVEPGSKLLVVVYYFDAADGTVHSSLYEYNGSGEPILYSSEKK